MARRNRVDPFGDLHAVSGRGLLTGNRGCLVNLEGEVIRHHGSSSWICCVTSFRDRRMPLAAFGHWTPIFFLDEAVALAAGHRPCAFCRPDAYRSYGDAATAAAGVSHPLLARELDRRLITERHRRGRGLVRHADRHVWQAAMADLPVGAVVLDKQRHPYLVLENTVLRFDFEGWTDPAPRPSGRTVDVLTPPTSVAALRCGFLPVLHPTAQPVVTPL